MSRLILVGGGHAHLEVLRSAGRAPMRGELLLISPARQQLYSGMMPGQLRGRWTEAALTMHLPALCKAAGAHFIEAAATRIDAALPHNDAHSARTSEVAVQLSNGDTLSGTLASLDIGATPAGIDIAGVRSAAFMTRPISSWRALLARVRALSNEIATAAPDSAPVFCCVVGGGAAGTELALALAARLREASLMAAQVRGAERVGNSAHMAHVAPRVVVTLVTSGTSVLSGYAAAAARRMHTILEQQQIRVETNATVREVTPTSVMFENGRQVASSLTIWATGASAPAIIRESVLPSDAAGFFAVDRTLRAINGAPVWGVGDCITMASAPWMTHSGVYAVRAAPVLARNLRSALESPSAAAERFTPQRHTMAILDTADGAALLSWRALAVHGGSPLRLKQWIDRRFVARYRL